MPYPNSGKTPAVNGKVNAKERHNTDQRLPGRCAMNPFVTLGLLFLLLALVFALDIGLALIAIDRLTQSEYSTVTDAPFRF